MRLDKKCPLNGVINYDRVWRRVQEIKRALECAAQVYPKAEETHKYRTGGKDRIEGRMGGKMNEITE